MVRQESEGIWKISASAMPDAAISVSARLRTTYYKNLLDVGLRGSRHAADCGSVDRRIPPAQHGKSFLAHNSFQDSLALQALMTFVAADAGHESDTAGVVLLRRMVQTLSGRRAIRFFQTRRHGHRLRRTPPLPDRLFWSWDFARKGCGGVAHSGSGTHFCRFLLTARRAAKYNSEFGYKGCKFQDYAWFEGKFSLILPQDGAFRYNPAQTQWISISSSRFWKWRDRAVFLALERKCSAPNRRSAPKSDSWSRSMVIDCSTAPVKP